MKKGINKKRFNFAKIIISLLLCFFCCLSFVGCVGGGGGTGGISSGGSSGSGGSSSGSGGSSGSGSGSGSSSEEKDPEDTLEDLNDVMNGAILVYDIDGDEDVFHDKYRCPCSDTNHIYVSFNSLVERQFNAMASYISTALNRIYGNSENNEAEIKGYNPDIIDLIAPRTLDISGCVSNTVQRTGFISSSNESKLFYKNAINGGYDLKAEINGDVTTYQYDEGSVLTANRWREPYAVTTDTISKVLAYIYLNQQDVSTLNNDLSFTSDVTLKNYYKSFDFDGSSVTFVDYNDITSIGITDKYIWNVAYCLAYSLIGENNMNNSLNNHNTVITGNNINTITEENVEKFKSYKGYHIVLKEIVEKIMNLYVVGNDQVGYSSTYNWQQSLFPNMNRLSYVYIQDVNLISDANNSDLFGEDADEDDFEVDEDGNLVQEPVDPGTKGRLKQIIMLPTINPSKFKGTSFSVNAFLCSFMSGDGKKYQVEITANAIFNDGTSSSEQDEDGKYILEPAIIEGEGNIINGRVVFDDTYSFDDDLVDVTLPFDNGKFDNAKSEDGVDIAEIINSSFADEENRTIEYEIAGTEKTFKIRNINVYNELIKSNGDLNLGKNIIVINFNYFNENGTAVDTPEMYLMYFCAYN